MPHQYNEGEGGAEGRKGRKEERREGTEVTWKRSRVVVDVIVTVK